LCFVVTVLRYARSGTPASERPPPVRLVISLFPSSLSLPPSTPISVSFAQLSKLRPARCLDNARTRMCSRFPRLCPAPGQRRRERKTIPRPRTLVQGGWRHVRPILVRRAGRQLGHRVRRPIMMRRARRRLGHDIAVATIQTPGQAPNHRPTSQLETRAMESWCDDPGGNSGGKSSSDFWSQ
jgi:hypothetical protein